MHISVYLSMSTLYLSHYILYESVNGEDHVSMNTKHLTASVLIAVRVNITCECGEKGLYCKYEGKGLSYTCGYPVHVDRRAYPVHVEGRGYPIHVDRRGYADRRGYPERRGYLSEGTNFS